MPLFKVTTHVTYKDDSKQIAKFEIGSPYLVKAIPHKVLMVMGATGAGKTTVLNALVNHIFDVQWEDSFRFVLVPENDLSANIQGTVRKERSQTQSQTQWITAYTLHAVEGSKFPCTLTIIDTPGFGDTRGLDRDRDIVQQIKEFFSTKGENGIDHINAVAFIAQAPNVRLTATQNYIFNSVLAVFGNDIASNIYVMATFADGEPPKVFEAVRAAGFPCCSEFMFNNSALYTSNTTTSNRFSKMFWDMGQSSFNSFLDALKNTESRSLLLTQEVLKQREHLEVCIQGLLPQINEGISTINRITKETQFLKDVERNADKYKNYTISTEVTKQRIIMLKPGEYVTNCVVCNRTCHFPCTIPNDGNKFNCGAMSLDEQDTSKRTCTVCPNKCHWKNHVNGDRRLEYYQVQELITLEELKAKYEKATHEIGTTEDMIKRKTAELLQIEYEVYSRIRKVHNCVKRLDEIALKPNPLTEVQYIELLIESEKAEKNPGCNERISQLERAKQVATVMKTVKNVDDPRELFVRLKEQGVVKDVELQSLPYIDGQQDSKRCSVM